MIRVGLLSLLMATAGVARAGSVEFRFTDRDDAPVGDVVVSLHPLDASVPASPADVEFELMQEGQEFIPYVSAVRVGTRLVLPNADTVEHHVYSQSDAASFNFPLYEPGTAESVLLEEPGVVTVGCNIHDWMIAHVVVVDTPWFSTSGAGGTVELDGLPAGRYRAEIWNPRLRRAMEQEVVVAEEGPIVESLSLTLRPDRRIRRPANFDPSNYP